MCNMRNHSYNFRKSFVPLYTGGAKPKHGSAAASPCCFNCVCGVYLTNGFRRSLLTAVVNNDVEVMTMTTTTKHVTLRSMASDVTVTPTHGRRDSFDSCYPTEYEPKTNSPPVVFNN